MIPFIDLLAVISAVWLLGNSISKLGKMSSSTSWIAYSQVLSVAAASTGLLLAYAQWLIPGARYVSFLNVGDATAMLLAALTAASIIDPRRRVKLETVRRADTCTVERSNAQVPKMHDRHAA